MNHLEANRKHFAMTTDLKYIKIIIYKLRVGIICLEYFDTIHFSTSNRTSNHVRYGNVNIYFTNPVWWRSGTPRMWITEPSWRPPGILPTYGVAWNKECTHNVRELWHVYHKRLYVISRLLPKLNFFCKPTT